MFLTILAFLFFASNASAACHAVISFQTDDDKVFLDQSVALYKKLLASGCTAENIQVFPRGVKPRKDMKYYFYNAGDIAVQIDLNKLFHPSRIVSGYREQVAALKKEVPRIRPEDSFNLFYSGHGGGVQVGNIRTSELNAVFSSMPKESIKRVFSDTCFSGKLISGLEGASVCGFGSQKGDMYSTYLLFPSTKNYTGAFAQEMNQHKSVFEIHKNVVRRTHSNNVGSTTSFEKLEQIYRKIITTEFSNYFKDKKVCCEKTVATQTEAVLAENDKLIEMQKAILDVPVINSQRMKDRLSVLRQQISSREERAGGQRVVGSAKPAKQNEDVSMLTKIKNQLFVRSEEKEAYLLQVALMLQALIEKGSVQDKQAVLDLWRCENAPF